MTVFRRTSTLSDKTILITGASSGLGRELALLLAPFGNRMILTARRKAQLEAVADDVRAAGSACLVCPADATEYASVERVLDEAIKRFGRIDIAVLNAGGGVATRMGETDAPHVLRVMRTNYDTLVHFLCPLIEHMRGTGGTIAYTGSPAGFFGLPKSGPYSASKAAGRVLFDTCRIELADSGIRFVALYPGFTRTPGLDESEVPVSALVINADRAAREMARAIAAGRDHTIFPKRIRFLIGLARLLPEPIRRRLLSTAA